MKSLLALIGLIAILFVGWTYRDRIPGPWNKGADERFATEVSEQSAAAADAKLERLREERDTIRLSSAEFTSYLRYRLNDPMAQQLESPVVSFSGDTVTLTGRFPTDRLPDTRQVRAVRSFLPDTADVKVTGALRPLEGGRAALRVDNVSFARLPIPAEVYDQALERLGPRDAPGLASNEYAFPLPPGVGSARVENGTLVLAPN